jgi:hypothetical protein
MYTIILVAPLMATPAHLAETREESLAPEAVVTGFDQRVEQIFRAESGKPLVREKKRPPLGPGRGNYVRAYSYSMVEFAARCLYLNEMLDEANAALAENAQHYLDNPKDINDRDSFHWHADIVMRLIEMYGTNGTEQAGRIPRETEALCLKPIWLYAKKSSWLGKAEHEESKTWHIFSSENHHAMDFTVCWHFAKIAKDRPEYRKLKFDDGATAAEHYRAWNEYFIVYCRERARKGPCIEMMCPGYNSVWLKGFFNFHDFGDERVCRSAAMLFDLYWAYWAQEQIGGVDGGGKSRIRGVKGFTRARHGIPDLGWLYFGIGEPPSILAGNLNAALSGYRPPAVIADIAWNARGNGPFEVRQRAQGLGKQGIAHPVATESKVPNKLRTDGGGIIRYSYCDPAFTIGTLMFEARPLEAWVHISAQGRWQGVVFAGRADSRIVPIVWPRKGRDVLNGQWSVQSKGCLITQKLKDHKGGGEMIVWMSKEGLEPPVTKGNVVFIEAERAYAGVRVVTGGFQLVEDSLATKAADGGTRTAPPGRVLIPEREFSPVILEVMAKDQVKSFEEFQDKVLACEWKMDGPALIYDSIYVERFTFDSSFQNVPTINGQPIDYTPPKVLESPFLNADYNSGVVTISKGERKKVLDFRR